MEDLLWNDIVQFIHWVLTAVVWPVYFQIFNFVLVKIPAESILNICLEVDKSNFQALLKASFKTK